jgi:hypothetical protein
MMNFMAFKKTNKKTTSLVELKEAERLHQEELLAQRHIHPITGLFE